jgi:hypothetical protein
LRGGMLPKALTRPFEVIYRRGNAGINLGAGDAVRIKARARATSVAPSSAILLRTTPARPANAIGV